MPAKKQQTPILDQLIRRGPNLESYDEAVSEDSRFALVVVANFQTSSKRRAGALRPIGANGGE